MKRVVIAMALASSSLGPSVLAAPALPGVESDTQPLKSPALQKLQRRAQEAFGAKRFDEAVTALKQLLTRQPGHILSQILLARSYYQLKNNPEAYTIAKTLDFGTLYPEASYELGMVAFRSNDFELGLKGFLGVPSGHSLFDLAGFYGGICAFKLAEYQQAIDLFDQAVVLPSKLTRSQKVYRKEAEKRLLQVQKQELLNGAKSPQSKTREPSFGVRPERGADLSARLIQQNASTKSGNKKDESLMQTQIKASWGGSSWTSGMAKSQWTYQGQVTVAQTDGRDKEVLILPEPTDKLEREMLRLYSPKDFIKTEVSGGYERTIGRSSSLGLQLGALSFAPESDFQKRIFYSPYAKVLFQDRDESVETSLRAESYAHFDAQELREVQSMQEGRIAFLITPALSVGLRGQLFEYSYNLENLSGPDFSGRVILEGIYRAPQSFVVSAAGSYDIAERYRLYNETPDVPLLRFGQTQMGFHLRGEYEILSFWTAGIEADYAARSYSNPMPTGAQAYLDSGQPNSVMRVGAMTRVFKNF